MSALSDSMGLKDDILANISKAVKAIQVIQVSSKDEAVVLRNSDWQCHELSKHLDMAFLHRRRHARNGYWKIVAEFSLKEIVSEIRRLRHVTTDLGRGRAWLFVALNNYFLESYIRCFQQNQELLSKYYVRDALVRDQERLNVLLTLTAGLENAVFRLEMDMPYLDLCSYPPKSCKSSESADEERIVLCSIDRVVYIRHRLPSVSQCRCNFCNIPTDTDSGSVACKDICLLSPRTKQYSRSLNFGCNNDVKCRQRRHMTADYEGDYEREARFRRLEALMNSDDGVIDGSCTLVVIPLQIKYRQKVKKKTSNKIRINDLSRTSLVSHSLSNSEGNSAVEHTRYTNRQSRERKVKSHSHKNSNKHGSNIRSIKSGSDSSGSTSNSHENSDVTINSSMKSSSHCELGLNIHENNAVTINSSMKSSSQCELGLETSNKGDSKIFTEQFKFHQNTVTMNVEAEPPKAAHSNHKCCNDNDISKATNVYKSQDKPQSSDCANNVFLRFSKTLIEPDVQYNGDISKSGQKTEQLIADPVCLCYSTEDIYASGADHEELSTSTMQTAMTNILNTTQTLKDENKSRKIKVPRDSAIINKSFNHRSATYKLSNRESTALHSFYARLKTSPGQKELKTSTQLKNAYSDNVQLTNESAKENASENSIGQSNAMNSNSRIFTDKAPTGSVLSKSPDQSELRNATEPADISSNQNVHNKANEEVNVDKLANQNLSTQLAAMHLQNGDNDIINEPNTSHYFSSITEADGNVVDFKDTVEENEDSKLCPGEVRLDINSMLFLMLDVMGKDEVVMKMFSCLLGYTEGETKVIFILISSRALYLLTQERKNGKFTTVAVIRFPEIDFVSLGMNYQLVYITCKSRQKQYCLSTGDEISTKAIVDCLVSAMENDYLPMKVTVDTEATIHREAFRKYIATECKCDLTEAKLQYYSLVHWEDPQTRRGQAGSSEREGYLLYKHKESCGLPLGNTWNPAYAILRDCMLCIYNDKNDFKPHTIVNLGKEECVGCKLDLNSERPHSIKIILANGDAFWLWLSMEVEVNIWLQSLCQALAEGLQMRPARASCLPFCLVLTSQKLLMCHENLQTRSIRTMGSASLVDITDVLTDSTMKTYCVLEFGSLEARISSEKWVFYFSSENEVNKFLQALSTCWSEHFQVEIPQLPIQDASLQRKCREMAILLKNELKLKPVW